MAQHLVEASFILINIIYDFPLIALNIKTIGACIEGWHRWCAAVCAFQMTFSYMCTLLSCNNSLSVHFYELKVIFMFSTFDNAALKNATVEIKTLAKLLAAAHIVKSFFFFAALAIKSNFIDCARDWGSKLSKLL